MIEIRHQAVTGLVSPDVCEAKVREAWPSVARFPALAALGQTLTRTIILAPLAWLVMSLAYFGKLLPFSAMRYRLTNRRLMIMRGWYLKPSDEILLANIEGVRLVPESVDHFFRCGNLEILSEGKVAFTLVAVPSPEAFHHAIINARNAWVPGKAKTMPFIPASAK